MELGIGTACQADTDPYPTALMQDLGQGGVGYLKELHQ